MTAALEELRKIVATSAVAGGVTRGAGASPLSTGVARLDALLGGGLPRARLVEVTGPWPPFSFCQEEGA